MGFAFSCWSPAIRLQPDSQRQQNKGNTNASSKSLTTKTSGYVVVNRNTWFFSGQMALEADSPIFFARV
jgi:hypothetical protein